MRLPKYLSHKSYKLLRVFSYERIFMDKAILKWLFKPDIREPILVEGLPGFGNIGRLTARLLVDFCGGKRFLELYSPYFPDYLSLIHI